MQRINPFYLFLIAFLFTAVETAQSKKPDWLTITGLSQYREDGYIVGFGMAEGIGGESLQIAQDRARDEVSKQIKVSVKSVTRIHEEEINQQVREYFSSIIKSSTTLQLRGLQIEPYRDKDATPPTTYALAYAKKENLWHIYSQVKSNLDDQIRKISADAQKDESDLRPEEAIKKYLSLLPLYEALKEPETILLAIALSRTELSAFTGETKVKHKIGQLAEKFFRSPVQISLQIDQKVLDNQDNGDFIDLVKTKFNEVSIQVHHGAPLQLNIESLTIDPRKVGYEVLVRYSISFSAQSQEPLKAFSYTTDAGVYQENLISEDLRTVRRHDHFFDWRLLQAPAAGYVYEVTEEIIKSIQKRSLVFSYDTPKGGEALEKWSDAIVQYYSKDIKIQNGDTQITLLFPRFWEQNEIYAEVSEYIDWFAGLRKESRPYIFTKPSENHYDLVESNNNFLHQSEALIRAKIEIKKLGQMDRPDLSEVVLKIERALEAANQFCETLNPLDGAVNLKDREGKYAQELKELLETLYSPIDRIRGKAMIAFKEYEQKISAPGTTAEKRREYAKEYVEKIENELENTSHEDVMLYLIGNAYLMVDEYESAIQYFEKGRDTPDGKEYIKKQCEEGIKQARRRKNAQNNARRM